MTKTIKKLEKETIMWKQKWEKSNQSLLDLAGDVSLFLRCISVIISIVGEGGGGVRVRTPIF